MLRVALGFFGVMSELRCSALLLVVAKGCICPRLACKTRRTKTYAGNSQELGIACESVEPNETPDHHSIYNLLGLETFSLALKSTSLTTSRNIRLSNSAHQVGRRGHAVLTFGSTAAASTGGERDPAGGAATATRDENAM